MRLDQTHRFLMERTAQTEHRQRQPGQEEGDKGDKVCSTKGTGIKETDEMDYVSVKKEKIPSQNVDTFLCGLMN